MITEPLPRKQQQTCNQIKIKQVKLCTGQQNYSHNNSKMNSSTCSEQQHYDQRSPLHQIEIINHCTRKKQERRHSQTIGQFYKKKKEIVGLINSQKKGKKKRAEDERKANQCLRYMATHMGFSCQQAGTSAKRSDLDSVYPILSINKYIMSKNNQYGSRTGLNTPDFGSRNLTSGNSRSKSSANQQKRQIYISNINNLAELKQSLAYSRSKFHRKVIKMDRVIGKEYCPFEDQIPGGRDCIKGIFL